MPESHPLALGMTGIWGTPRPMQRRTRPTSCSPLARLSARPTAVRGTRASRSTIPPSRLIQIDIEPQEVGKIYPVRSRPRGRRAGDAARADPSPVESGAVFARRAQRAAAGTAPHCGKRSSARAQARRTAHRFTRRACSTKSRRSRRKTRSTSPTSAGTRTAPASSCRSRARVPSSPAAAWPPWASRPAPPSARRSARPDRKVICLVGDGGLLSALGALATAVELGVPVVWIAVQQLLLLDDPDRRHDVLQEQLRHRVHDARRQAVQPGLPAAREGVRHRERPGPRPGRSRSGAGEGDGR